MTKKQVQILVAAVRELIEAAESVACEYGCDSPGRTELSDLREALAKLREKLK